MDVSYSLHLGSRNYGLHTIGDIIKADKNNLRKYKSSEYDREKIERLIGSKSILRDVQQIYHVEFDKPLACYNQNKRKDRKIEDYLIHVSNSRADVAVELILQIGDKEFWKNKTLDERRLMSSIFQAQLDELQRLVPELKIASAVIHYDKSSPHLHVVAVPVADGYRKGMKKQVAKTKIFTQERLVGLQEAMHIHAQEQIRQCPNLFTGTSIKKIEKGHKYFTKEELGEYRAKKAEAAFH